LRHSSRFLPHQRRNSIPDIYKEGPSSDAVAFAFFRFVASRRRSAHTVFTTQLLRHQSLYGSPFTPTLAYRSRRWLAGEFLPPVLLPKAPQVVRSIRQPKQPVPISSTHLVSHHSTTPFRLQSNHPFSRHAYKMGCIRKDLIVLLHCFLTRGAMACLSA
jgi:hypothetical protein